MKKVLYPEILHSSFVKMSNKSKKEWVVFLYLPVEIQWMDVMREDG